MAATKVTKREVRGGDAVLPPQTLVAIMANLPRATPGQKLFRTMVLWHWFSQLRPCHFTYSAIKDHRSLLRWDQLVPTCEAHETLADAGITLIAIRTASKTNQAGINAFTTAVGCLCNTKSANKPTGQHGQPWPSGAVIDSQSWGFAPIKVTIYRQIQYCTAVIYF